MRTETYPVKALNPNASSINFWTAFGFQIRNIEEVRALKEQLKTVPAVTAQTHFLDTNAENVVSAKTATELLESPVNHGTVRLGAVPANQYADEIYTVEAEILDGCEAHPEAAEILENGGLITNTGTELETGLYDAVPIGYDADYMQTGMTVRELEENLDEFFN